MYIVKFLTITGTLQTKERKGFESMTDVRRAVHEYATSNGFTNVKEQDDSDDIRFTATTPGGRAGRNIAFCEQDY